MSNINVSGVPCAPMTTGKVFYVDLESGSNSSDGSNASYPLRTIEAALTQCLSGRGDVIVVSGKATLTSAIEITKDAVSIIGMPGYDVATGGEPRLGSSTSDLIHIFGASKVRIENLRLTQSGTGCAIKVGDTDHLGGSQLVLRNLAIYGEDSAMIGINIANGMSLSTLEDIQIVGSTAIAYGIQDNEAGRSLQNVYERIRMVGSMTVGIELSSSTKDLFIDCVSMGPTASVNVTGATSAIIGLAANVAASGTAKTGGAVTIS